MEQFWNKIESYAKLSDESKTAWKSILKTRAYKRNEYFLMEGEVSKSVAFIVKGLFSQYYVEENGDIVIKRFFPENYFAASASAMLLKTKSMFTIKALEPTTVLEYNFQSFKELTTQFTDIAAFYIRYMELHWVIEKEPLEISYRYDTAKTKYANFLKSYPNLEPRLKQHEIASYLGITPTQLSRIRAEL